MTRGSMFLLPRGSPSGLQGRGGGGLNLLVPLSCTKSDKYSDLNNPEAYDYISIKNIGLPIWTGGAFKWVKENGIEKFINTSDKFAKTLGSRFVLNENILNIIKSI